MPWPEMPLSRMVLHLGRDRAQPRDPRTRLVEQPHMAIASRKIAIRGLENRHVLDSNLQPRDGLFETPQGGARHRSHGRLETQPGAGSIWFEAHHPEEGEQDGARSAPAGTLAPRPRGSETDAQAGAKPNTPAARRRKQATV